MKGKERIGWFIVLCSSVSLLFIPEIIEPKPYTNVVRKEAFIKDERLFFYWNFKKIKCDIKRFDTVVGISGVTKLVTFRDEDGLTINDTRTSGLQTLRISIELENYDFVEFRTKHDCDGRSVFKLFDRIDNPLENMDKRG